jgi:hypothetical protein
MECHKRIDDIAIEYVESFADGDYAGEEIFCQECDTALMQPVKKG